MRAQQLPVFRRGLVPAPDAALACAWQSAGRLNYDAIQRETVRRLREALRGQK